MNPKVGIFDIANGDPDTTDPDILHNLAQQTHSLSLSTKTASGKRLLGPLI